MRCLATLLSLLAVCAHAQESPPPLPPPEDQREPAPAPPPAPVPSPGVLVPRAIANQPLPPEGTPIPTPAAPVTANTTVLPDPPDEPSFGRRFGPMGHLGIMFPIAPKAQAGLGLSLGLRFALMARTRVPAFNVAAGAFFSFEAVAPVPALSPGVRLELVGARGPVLIPYLGLSAFGQVLLPLTGKDVGVRGGLILAWNLFAAGGTGRGSWWHGFHWNGAGSSSWIIIPLAAVAVLITTFITVGDLRVFIQSSPTGGVIGGFSIGAGF
ncbi:MAG: hypothetical protein U0228_35505 [Myxococcaceae bacterium]